MSSLFKYFLLTLSLSLFSTSLFACAEFDKIISRNLKEASEETLTQLEKAGSAGKILDANGKAIDFQNETVRKLINNRREVLIGNYQFHPAPRLLPAFPLARMAKGKTPKRSGGGIRKRWIGKKGNIYEWDSQHGTIEKYNKTGKRHLGEYDPITGAQTKGPDPSRRVEK